MELSFVPTIPWKEFPGMRFGCILKNSTREKAGRTVTVHLEMVQVAIACLQKRSGSFAVRKGTETRYSFGDSDDLLDDYAWHDGNSDGKTHPVGKLRANPNGLFDMHGNVWEWVQDKYTRKLPGGTDPLHSSSGSSRVIRGGSWYYDAQYLRSANRFYGYPAYGYFHVGFRLVRTE